MGETGVATLIKSVDGVMLSTDFLLESVYLVGDGTNKGLVKVYEGLDTDGKLFAALRVTADAVSSISFGDGRIVAAGAYIDVTTVGYVIFVGKYI